MAALYPEDFQGAAQEGIDIILISSDEESELDTVSITSVIDLQFSSDEAEEDDEIRQMAQCVEMKISAPIQIPVPVNVPKTTGETVLSSGCNAKPPGSAVPSNSLFDKSYFLLGRGNGPIRRDSRVRNNHPIALCRNIIPMMDTPMSAPP